MSEWLTFDEDFASDPLLDVEDLLRTAADEMPVVRSGLKAEIITRAERDQRELRCQHVLWGAVTLLLFSLGTLISWPAHSSTGQASRESHAPKPVNASLLPATDAVDWDLVESKTRLRERNLEILQDAF
jgi:hypothetical protein